MLRLYEHIGKYPVKVGSRYGYAVDPVFEGLTLACIQCVDHGLGDIKQVDVIASRCLGLTVGPFTAQNLCGGNPISAHGLAEMNTRLNPWFRVPLRLQQIVEAKADWEAPVRGEVVEVSEEQEKAIAEELVGELNKAHLWSKPIVTQILPLETFYPAEDYHREYFSQHPEQAYCQMVISPKVSKFRKQWANRLKS